MCYLINLMGGIIGIDKIFTIRSTNYTNYSN